MINKNFVILGAILSLIGGISYLLDTIRGKTKPNRVSWLLWALAPMIAFSAELKQGVGLQSLMTFMVGFNPLLIFLASFVNRKAKWKLAKLDLVCGALSVIGIILWRTTGSGNLAIFFSIVADALAGVPTIIKSYLEPGTESYKVFMFGAIIAGITLLAIDNWSFANWGFPLYILAICLLLVVLIRFEVGIRWKPLEEAANAGEDERTLP
jgi:hypothetical protein